MNIAEFHMKHEGETALIVGLGPNLAETPPERFNYPSFSVNSIYKYTDWKPTYYVGVDQRLWDENTSEIFEKFGDVIKFIPSPDYDYIDGANLVRFRHRWNGQLYIGGQLPNHPESLNKKRGITYRRVMGAVFQIAFYMGFSRLLLIGISHKPEDAAAHFWGEDTGCVVDQPIENWFEEYSQWANCGLAEVLNLSVDTYVPENVIPRADWRKFANA